MSATPTQVVRQYLINMGVVSPVEDGGTPDWPAGTGMLPTQDDAPDQFVAVRDYGSTNRGGNSRDPSSVDESLVQVMVRATAYDVGMLKANEITTAVRIIGKDPSRGGLGTVFLTVGSESWALKTASVLTSPTPMGQEEKNQRQHFSINLQVQVDLLTDDPTAFYLIGADGMKLAASDDETLTP